MYTTLIIITCAPVASTDMKLEKKICISKLHHSQHIINIAGNATVKYSPSYLNDSLVGRNQASLS